ncbi:MAG: PEGA domain-containing protein, partial [Myxococcales bacterium]|nr:PEGA domain-containing protein [Myxococcales bacterium]
PDEIWNTDDPRTVPILVRSQPDGAEVYIDTMELGPVGRTPLRYRLFAGPHVIIVTKSHHSVWREVVNLEPLE